MEQQTWKTIFHENQYEEENLENQSTPLRDGTIFLLDANPDMFVKYGNDISPFNKSLQSIRDWMLRDVIANDRNMVGIIIFGCEQAKNQNDFKHIYIYQEFAQLNADRIKEIENFLKNIKKGDTHLEFGNVNKVHQPVSIAETLWTSTNQYLYCKYKMGIKKIYIFTCNDSPHPNESHLRKQAIQRGHDVNELDIDMELVGFPNPSLPKNEQFFDMTLFYKDLLTLTEDEVESYPTAEQILEELSSRLRVKDFQKKAIAKLQLRLGHGVTLGVSLYTLVNATKVQPAIKMDKDTLEEISVKVKEEPGLALPTPVDEVKGGDLRDEDGAGEVSSDQPFSLIQKYMVFGGAKIYFDTSEIKDMKNFGEPGLTLIGFKPSSFLKPYWFVRTCQFIYPNEGAIIGSTKLLRALLLRCLARKVVPVCSFISRHYGSPSIVALIPQVEELNEEGGVQIQPPGFHVMYLPFAEDFRKVPWPEPSPLNFGKEERESALERAKEMIQRLKFTYSLTNFENPVLQKHYRVLEALALDRPMTEVEAFKDTTLPDNELIDRRLKKYVAEFKDVAFPPGYEPTQPGAKGPAKVTLSKRIDTPQILKCIESNELGRMTLPILKEFCKILNIKKSTGTKDSYITVLKAYYDRTDHKKGTLS